jgi:2',3'-cyclic-nucleotide 2'-phosphodiesterase (5'-nucleotidase family)
MLKILHTNDFHGALDETRQARLAELRKEVDLYFDCGDCIKVGNLAIPLKADPVWPKLAALHCTASVPGNRESHPIESTLKAKIRGASTPILCANLKRKSTGKLIFPPSLLIEVNGLKVGVFGVMVAMVTERMATKAASQLLWDDPIKTALQQAEQLKAHVDVLIALTHIGYKKDIELAKQCSSIDIIFGGHSHTVLEKAEMIGNTAICQAGSHGRFAGLCHWRGSGQVLYSLSAIGG